MPIHPLSDATSRVLVSTQALNDATSVIKELLENALDARATSISVEISADTLEKIIVKDDGSGINVEDRLLLCKSGCTSKIANLDDLAELGGSFLGFRGTALASVAELSKQVTVVTRIDGEQPATTLTFGSNGELLSSASASHNVGTTVRVESFLASIPVRRQFTAKNTTKILDDIRKLLQVYALARPKVKLAFKVLKAKNEKFNWSFAPCKAEDLLMSAAVQVVGKAVASLCVLSTARLEDDRDKSVYFAEALMLDVENNDVSKAGNVGQYLTIDGRPIGHEKGVMKEVFKLYKTYLKNASRSDDFHISKPFLILQIRCPLRSYDVNIEPAKDVVLFHDNQKILDLARKLFIDTYGELKEQQHEKKGTKERFNTMAATSFDVLLPRKRIHAENKDSQSHNDAQAGRINPNGLELPRGHTKEQLATDGPTETMGRSLPRPITVQMRNNTLMSQVPDATHRIHGNMYTIDEELQNEIMDAGSLTVDSEEEKIYDPHNTMMNNPFIRAKALSLHIPTELRDSESKLHFVGLLNGSKRLTGDPKTATDGLQPVARRAEESAVQGLPTPKKSPFKIAAMPYQNPGPPFPRRNKRSQEDDEDEHFDSDLVLSEQQQQLMSSQQSLLNNWIRSPPTEVSLPGFQRASLGVRSDSDTRQLSSPLSHRMQAQTNPQNPYDSPNVINKPFRSPLKNSHPEKLQTPGSGNGRTFNRANDGAVSAIVPGGDDADLHHILDFEQRKREINQRLKLNRATLNPADLARIQRSSDVTAECMSSDTSRPAVEVAGASVELPRDLAQQFNGNKNSHRSQATPSKISNPHHNRYLAAVRNLESPNRSRSQVDVSAPSENSNPENRLPNIPVKPERPLSHTTDDPRAFLISIRSDPSLSDVPQGKNKRYKSNRLPFETIAADIRKHNILAIPQNPAPSEHRIRKIAQALALNDTYVATGTIQTIQWSPTSKDVKRWQENLQELVQTQYRATNHHNTNGKEDGEELTGVPNIEISLARALKAHVDLN